MKKPFKISAIASCVMLMAGCEVQDKTEDTSPVTLFVSNDIITLDDNETEKPNAVAVQDGVIVGVGQKSELISEYESHSSFTINDDYLDKTMVAGFVDPHMHIWLTSLLLGMDFITPADWSFPWGDTVGVQTEEAYFDQLTRLEASLPEGEPLFTWGYHNYFHGQNMSREALNEISSTRPMIIWHRSFHEVYFNDAALEMFGWDEDIWKSKGTDMLNWEKGHAYEVGLKAVMGELFSHIQESGMFAEGVKRSRDYIHAGGITTAIDPGVLMSPEMYNQMVDILTAEKFPMDYWLIPAGNFTYMMSQNDAAKGKEMAEEQTVTYQETDQIKWLPKYIKLFSDGAMYSQLMQMKDGYTDGHEGEWIQTPTELKDSMKPYWNDDYTVIVHANGDLGFETAIDIVEELDTDHPREDHRTGYHHLGFTDKNDIHRAVEQGANFSVNPYYTHILGEQYGKEGIGKERADVMSRGQSFIEAGGLLSLHSDAPMAPAQPLSLIWTAVNRVGLSGETVLGKDEKITVMDALKAVTVNAAYTARLEDEIGSIEVGKYANFTILSDSPLQVDPKDINKIDVNATVYRGEASPIELGADKSGMQMSFKSHKAIRVMSMTSDADFCTTSVDMQRAALESGI